MGRPCELPDGARRGRSAGSSSWPSGSTASWGWGSSSRPPRSPRNAPGAAAVLVFAAHRPGAPARWRRPSPCSAAASTWTGARGLRARGLRRLRLVRGGLGRLRERVPEHGRGDGGAHAAPSCPRWASTGRSPRRAAATVLVTTLALVVATGIRISARTWTALTVLKLLPLLALLAGLPPARTGGLARARGRRGLLAARGPDRGVRVPGLRDRSRDRGPRPIVRPRACPSRPWARCSWRSCSTSGSSGPASPRCPASPPPRHRSRRPPPSTGERRCPRLVAWGTSVSALGICLGMMVTTPRYLSALAAGERELLGLEREATSAACPCARWSSPGRSSPSW